MKARSHSECGRSHKWCDAHAARLSPGLVEKGKVMDERMLQFALFLVIVVAFPVLIALGVDIARRIAARASSVARDHAPRHPELH